MSNPLNIYHTFNNPLDNYSLQYPSDWKFDSSNTTVYLTNDGAEVKIQSELIAPNTTLDDFVRQEVTDINNSSTTYFKVGRISQSDITFKGLPTIIVKYSMYGINDNYKMNYQSWYFIRGDRLYVVDYKERGDYFTDFYPAVQKILDSLTFNT